MTWYWELEGIEWGNEGYKPKTKDIKILVLSIYKLGINLVLLHFNLQYPRSIFIWLRLYLLLVIKLKIIFRETSL